MWLFCASAASWTFEIYHMDQSTTIRNRNPSASQRLDRPASASSMARLINGAPKQAIPGLPSSGAKAIENQTTRSNPPDMQFAKPAFSIHQHIRHQPFTTQAAILAKLASTVTNLRPASTACASFSNSMARDMKSRVKSRPMATSHRRGYLQETKVRRWPFNL